MQPPIPEGGIEKLSDRDKKLLSLMAQGFANGEIGMRMGIKADSVEMATGRIAVKLDMPSYDHRFNRRVMLSRWWWLEGDDFA